MNGSAIRMPGENRAATAPITHRTSLPIIMKGPFAMEQPQTGSVPTLKSNLDQLVRELHLLATRVKQPDLHQQRDDAQSGQGQYLVATGRS